MKKLIFILCGMLLCTHTIMAQEGPKKAQLKACAVLWAPFITKKDGASEMGGPDTEILKLVASRHGYEVSILEMPWKRCLEMAKKGDIDIVFSASDKADRREFLLYPKTPLHTTRYVFVIKAGTPSKWETTKDPKSLPQPVGSVLGYSISDDLKIKQVKVDDGATSDAQNVEKFFNGRVTSFVIEESVLKALLESKFAEAQKSTQIEILEPPYESDKNYYITISKNAGGNPDQGKAILTLFEDELTKMSMSGELKRIYETALKKVE